MKTIIVGAGKGCQAVLELVVRHRLVTLSLEIMAVVDIDPEAVGLAFARKQGWNVLTSLDEAMKLEGLELVIELTDSDSIRDEVIRKAPPHVRVMDHYMARVFWDLDEVAINLQDELGRKTELEATIRKDQRRLQGILDSLPDVVMVLDKERRIEHVNQRFEERTGLRFDSVVGRVCDESIFPTGCMDKDDPDCPFKRVMGTGRPVSVIRSRSCTDQTVPGGECYYQVTANPIRDKDGNNVSVVVTSREVTERIQLKRETEVSARRFRQILETVHGIVTIKGLDGRYQVVNPQALKFAGLPPEAFIGKTAGEIFPRDMADLFVKHDGELQEKRQRVSHEEVFFYNNQERILVSERMLLTDYEDKPIGICCVSRDMTRQKQLQRELIQSEKHAAVGKLSAAVAHEINNPLTGILTFAKLLCDNTSPDDPNHEDYETIFQEAMRCRQIVRDLLDFSRHSKPKLQETAIDSVVIKAKSLVRNQAPFHSIRFNLQFDAGAPKVYGDPNQLQQVVLNLIINARDAMNGSGEIRIGTSSREDPEKIILEVADHGCGIAPSDLSKIFEPFFSTKGGQGNGLGLAAVSSIVTQHGGDIAVESAIGQGTTFRVSLPGAPEGEKSGRLYETHPAGPTGPEPESS